MTAALTPEVILDAAEDVLRRFGPEKANVVDVARALGVSHGSVYRHFASKAALREAVVERFLAALMQPLAAIAAADGPAPARLRAWLMTLSAQKRARRRDDAALFATYMVLTMQCRHVVEAHVAQMVAQLAVILRAGMAAGDFAPAPAEPVARAVLDATAKFHHPAHAANWDDVKLAADFEAVWHLVLRGLG